MGTCECNRKPFINRPAIETWLLLSFMFNDKKKLQHFVLMSKIGQLVDRRNFLILGRQGLGTHTRYTGMKILLDTLVIGPNFVPKTTPTLFFFLVIFNGS